MRIYYPVLASSPNMFFFSIPILLPLLFLAPTTILTASLSRPQGFSDLMPVLCYDSRYTIKYPVLADCVTIINRQIAQPQQKPSNARSFSRHPNRQQLRLPYTWATERQECSVTIDILRLPGERVPDYAIASLNDIKRAAFEVLIACVLGDEHLGGVTQTGVKKNLQVRIGAGGQNDDIRR